MGGVPVKHHSKSKVGRRRSQLALARRVFVACPNCKSPAVPHRTCAHCGWMVLASRTRPVTPVRGKEANEDAGNGGIKREELKSGKAEKGEGKG